MNWKRWKIGIAVAVFTGAFKGMLGFTLGVSLRDALVMLCVNVAPDVLLFLKQHPVEAALEEDSEPPTKPQLIKPAGTGDLTKP